MQRGKLLAIAAKAQSRGPMHELDRAEITTAEGIVGDFRGEQKDRQVTVLAVESWNDACSQLDRQMPWTTRRANLLIEGVGLAHSKDQVLQLGSVVLKVTGETEPCSRMDELCPGLCQALAPHWRGGVCCEVISGGSIIPGESLPEREKWLSEWLAGTGASTS